MGKLAQATSKYTIYARFDAEGIVEKPDVIGAVFGQTEGLLGPDMELRELQKTGRIGRIDVDMRINNGRASGTIIIPSSLDSSETALIAACIETIDRVGPCLAKIFIEKIEDTRITKRKYVVDRAKFLLGRMFQDEVLDPQQITEQIKEAVRTEEISDYKGLPAGPNIEKYDEIIIVEGRADVINLLKNGIKNVVAIEGTSVPKSITDLTKQKTAIAFLDGDRGGDLILKELITLGEIDSVVRAPRGKEVEELEKKEIFKILRSRVPLGQGKTEIKNGEDALEKEILEPEIVEKERPTPFTSRKVEGDKIETFKTVLDDLIGTRAACFLDESMEILGRVPVKEMFSAMHELNANTLIFDGDIDQKLINQCLHSGIKYIVGMKVGRIRTPEGMSILTIHDLK